MSNFTNGTMYTVQPENQVKREEDFYPKSKKKNKVAKSSIDVGTYDQGMRGSKEQHESIDGSNFADEIS